MIPHERTSLYSRILSIKQLMFVDEFSSGPEQRSEAWYARRDQMVTASDFGKVLKSEAYGGTRVRPTPSIVGVGRITRRAPHFLPQCLISLQCPHHRR